MTSSMPRKVMGQLAVMVTAWAIAVGPVALAAQQGRQGQPPPTPQARPAIDLTGTWVSVVTEDWRWRMVTPSKGDYASVPLNPEGRKAADAWDLARDVAQGNQCRPFGVGNIMRMPGRVRISWQDPQTLKLDYDAGTQTRLLHFDKTRKPGVEKTWQGFSVAGWEFPGGEGPGSLKVVTTSMRPGYLRKNGVPYSENMVMTEYFDRHNESNGDQWFTVTTIIEDPKYLNQQFITTTHFKKEPDASKWRPAPCAIDPPLK
jgi:hypothetical protein